MVQLALTGAAMTAPLLGQPVDRSTPASTRPTAAAATSRPNPTTATDGAAPTQPDS